jgi:hypothetical protein
MDAIEDMDCNYHGIIHRISDFLGHIMEVNSDITRTILRQIPSNMTIALLLDSAINRIDLRLIEIILENRKINRDHLNRVYQWASHRLGQRSSSGSRSFYRHICSIILHDLAKRNVHESGGLYRTPVAISQEKKKNNIRAKENLVSYLTNKDGANQAGLLAKVIQSVQSDHISAKEATMLIIKHYSRDRIPKFLFSPEVSLDFCEAIFETNEGHTLIGRLFKDITAAQARSDCAKLKALFKECMICTHPDSLFLAHFLETAAGKVLSQDASFMTEVFNNLCDPELHLQIRARDLEYMASMYADNALLLDPENHNLSDRSTRYLVTLMKTETQSPKKKQFIKKLKQKTDLMTNLFAGISVLGFPYPESSRGFDCDTLAWMLGQKMAGQMSLKLSLNSKRIQRSINQGLGEAFKFMILRFNETDRPILKWMIRQYMKAQFILPIDLQDFWPQAMAPIKELLGKKACHLLEKQIRQDKKSHLEPKPMVHGTVANMAADPVDAPQQKK